MGRSGGIDGNAALTSSVAIVLTALLLAEGVTILDMGGLRTPHMLIGLVLVPPLLVKLASTGYRFVRYYTGARAYREKGPPHALLRMLAPVLVVATIGVFVTGIALLLLGHRSDTLIEAHKVSFIVWGVVFAVHFLGHLPTMLRWVARAACVPGAQLRLALVGTSVAGGLGLALIAAGAITGWHGGR
jgi:hypothetical protein